MNDTSEERSVNDLYLGPADNSFGHSVFRLQTTQKISVLRMTLIPMIKDIEDRVNKMIYGAM